MIWNDILSYVVMKSWISVQILLNFVSLLV